MNAEEAKKIAMKYREEFLAGQLERIKKEISFTASLGNFNTRMLEIFTEDSKKWLEENNYKYKIEANTSLIYWD